MPNDAIARGHPQGVSIIRQAIDMLFDFDHFFHGYEVLADPAYNRQSVWALESNADVRESYEVHPHLLRWLSQEH